MASLEIQTWKKGAQTKKGTRYQVRLRYDGRRYTVPAFDTNATGKKLSLDLARQMELLLQNKATGAGLPPELRRYVERLPERIRRSMARQGIIEASAEGKNLAAHVADYRTFLEGKGNTPKHVRESASMLTRAFEAMGMMMFGELTLGKVEQYLAAEREDQPVTDSHGKARKDESKKVIMKPGMSARRYNAILTSLGSFCRWAMRERRIHENPLLAAHKLNERVDRRHVRRALTADEVRALLESTAAGPERFGYQAAERGLMYRVAVETGLRLNEIATLTAGCVQEGSLVVRAGYSKRRREDVLPLRAELLKLLRTQAANKLPRAYLWTCGKSWNGRLLLKAFKEDLQAAKIARVDQEGRKLDFHALRHTFVTSLAEAGVHPKVAQSLARHSTISLTMDRYTHSLRDNEALAIEALPDYGVQKQAATGTNGGSVWGGAWDNTTQNNATRRNVASSSTRAMNTHQTPRNAGVLNAVAGNTGGLVNRPEPDSNRRQTDLQSETKRDLSAATIRVASNEPQRMGQRIVHLAEDLAKLPENVVAGIEAMVRSIAGVKNG